MARLKLFWNNVQNATSYNIYYGTSPGITTSNGIAITNITDVVYFHEGLQSGTTYYYIIVAVDMQGNLSAPSSEFSAITSVASSLEIVPDDASIPHDMTQQYTALLHYSDGSAQDITALATWDTDNHAVATVDISGLLTGIAAGTTNVTATYLTYDGYTPVEIT